MSKDDMICVSCGCDESDHMLTADRICHHPDDCRGFDNGLIPPEYKDEVEELMDTSNIPLFRRNDIEKKIRTMLIDAEIRGFSRARRIVTESFTAQKKD